MQGEISDWLTLVIDTYEELKEETTMSNKLDEGGGIGGAPHHHNETKRTTQINTGSAANNRLGSEGNPVDAILRASIVAG